MKTSKPLINTMRGTLNGSLFKPLRTFMHCVGLTFALSCRFAFAEVELVKVGEPTFMPTEFALTTMEASTNRSERLRITRQWLSDALGENYVVTNDPAAEAAGHGFFPVGPADGRELREAIARAGAIDTDVFFVDEMELPFQVQNVFTLVPLHDAPTGTSIDGSNGPIIPNEIYPIAERNTIVQNGRTLSTFGFRDRLASLDSYGEIIDENGELRDFTDLNWPHQISQTTLAFNSGQNRLGEFQWKKRIRDFNGNGWDLIHRYSVVERPDELIAGDLSYDGLLDQHDLNILTQNVAVGATNLKLDMNGDQTVDAGDIHHWVTDLKSTWIGDANLDGEFNSVDIVNVLQAGKFSSDQRARWNEGDWNGDERFDRADVIVALQDGGYGQGPLSAPANQAARGEQQGGPFAAIRPRGSMGDSQTSIVYNPGNGDLSLDAPAGVELTSINIDSAAGIFTGEAAMNLGGSFDNDADSNIFKATFGGSFGSLSFGNVTRTDLSEEFVLGDLNVVGSLAGGGDLGNVDLVYVPEPTSVLLLSVGLAIGLLHLRRATR